MIETVRIVTEVTEENPNGFIVINKSDFVDEEMKIFYDPVIKPEPEKKAIK